MTDKQQENLDMIRLMTRYPIEYFMDPGKIKGMATAMGWSLRKFQEILTRLWTLKRKGLI